MFLEVGVGAHAPLSYSKIDNSYMCVSILVGS
jgi:hypothetical protein